MEATLLQTLTHLVPPVVRVRGRALQGAPCPASSLASRRRRGRPATHEPCCRCRRMAGATLLPPPPALSRDGTGARVKGVLAAAWTLASGPARATPPAFTFGCGQAAAPGVAPLRAAIHGSSRGRTRWRRQATGFLQRVLPRVRTLGRWSWRTQTLPQPLRRPMCPGLSALAADWEGTSSRRPATARGASSRRSLRSSSVLAARMSAPGGRPPSPRRARLLTRSP